MKTILLWIVLSSGFADAVGCLPVGWKALVIWQVEANLQVKAIIYDPVVQSEVEEHIEIWKKAFTKR